jgi:hypothetical protein
MTGRGQLGDGLGSSVVLGEGFEQLHVETETQHGVVCWLKKNETWISL